MKFTLSNKNNGSNHRLTRPKNSLFHKIGNDFVIDWLVILCFGVVIVVGYVFFGYIKYVSSTSVIDSPANISAPTIMVKFNEQKLTALLERYKEKQNIASSTMAGKFSIPDPGL